MRLRRFWVRRINRQLLDQCLDAFIAHPKIWDQRGYIKETSEGPKYCLAGLVVAMSGRARKVGPIWHAFDENDAVSTFHEEAQWLLKITTKEADDIFNQTVDFDSSPERFKQLVHERLGIKS